MVRVRQRPQWKVMTVNHVKATSGVTVYNIVKIEADYHRIVDGTLFFRNHRGPTEYPELVHAFAPGHWLEMKRA